MLASAKHQGRSGRASHYRP